MAKQITRRTFLGMSALAVGSALAACAQPAAPAPAPTAAPAKAAEPTKAPAPAPTTAPAPTAAPAKAAEPTKAPAAAAPASAFKEAPMLADMVKAGKLPPVDQRLPKEPQVVKTFKDVGAYGNTLRFGQPDSGPWSFTCLRCTGLFEYDFANSQIKMSMGKAYKFSPDATTFTIELRSGQKWSDGTPFTADDIMFWWEDVENNKDLRPARDKFWQAGGKDPTFKKVSDTVLEITFAIPYPVVLDRLGRSWFSSENLLFGPAAYLKKYHLKYNAKAEDIAKEEKFDDWKKLFASKWDPAGRMLVGRPTLWPWMPESLNTERAICVRNPYYLGVDQAGNQLPYLDKLDCQITGNRDVLILKASSGELDFEAYHMNLKDMPVFKQNETKGNFRTLLPKQLRTSDMAIMPNRTVQDPVLKELFNNKDFRIALSVAINRKAINDALYFGLATPYPGAGHPGLPFVKKEWQTMYIEYDVKKANDLLDKIGLTKKDADGYRLRSDGKGRISLIQEIGVLEGPKQEICEMVNKDWKAVGIEATVKVYEGALFNQRHLANELQMPNWHTDRAALGGRSNPLFFGWDDPTQQRWGGQWCLWFQTNGKEGVEPPAEIKKNRDDLNKWRGTMLGTPEFTATGAEFHKYFFEEIPMIGTVGLAPIPMVVSNRLQNVNDGPDISWTSDTNFYAPYHPEQWWIKA